MGSSPTYAYRALLGHLQTEYTGDAQLVNSVYLDNESLEVYHGRLDQRPTSVAIRISWYGSQAPQQLFVERKTHRDTLKEEGDIKDAFPLPDEAVAGFLDGIYTVEQAKEYWRSEVGAETRHRTSMAVEQSCVHPC